MMNEFEFGFELQLAALAFVLLLIIVLIFFMVRKRIPKKVNPKEDYKISEPIKQEEIKLSTEPLSESEPEKESIAVSQAETLLSKSEPFVEKQTNEPSIASLHDNLPQDSMLRRHSLTNLRAMIESLKLPRPTDSTLSRHYDSLLIAEIGQCLSDEAALARLIRNYEDHKKSINQPIQPPQSIAEPLGKPGTCHENSVILPEKFKLPEDSILRRHTMTHLHALVESKMPPRPTDSVLRRHYDTMVNDEVKKFL